MDLITRFCEQESYNKIPNKIPGRKICYRIGLSESLNGKRRLEDQWAEMVKTHPATPSYHHLDDDLEASISEVYRHLGLYIENVHNAEKLAHMLMRGVPRTSLILVCQDSCSSIRTYFDNGNSSFSRTLICATGLA